MPAPIIAFDLDGTLVDTAPDLVATLNALLARRGLREIEAPALRNMIGGGAKVLIERALADQHVVLPHIELEALHADFLAHYAAHIADRSKPYEGVEAVLDTLAAEGFGLAVCTNKLEWLSVRLLERVGLAHRFAVICGQDTFAVRKPDPDMLRLTVARAGGRAERAVMVGDSVTDIGMARAAGIPVVAVDYGYTDVPVSELGPDRVISRFDDLPDAVRELMLARM